MSASEEITIKKVLTVDDDPTVRTLVRAILEAAGYEVVAAADGIEAFSLLSKIEDPNEFYCILLDVEMPGMSGFDILTRIRLHPSTQNIPVIMLTCQSSPEDILGGYNVGADYYITKPFTTEQLLFGIKLATR